MATFDSDTFTGTAGTLLTAHTPGAGGSWLNALGSGVITAAGRARANTTASECDILIQGTPATADYDVQGDLFKASASTNYGGIIGRSNAAATTLFEFYYDGATANVQWTIEAGVANSFVTVGVSKATLAVGSTTTMILKMHGTTIEGWAGGVKVISGTNSSVTAAGKAGIITLATTASDTIGFHIDNFSATDFVAGSTGTIAAAPAAFTTAFSGNAGEQGTIAAAPNTFTVTSSGTFTSSSSGTIAAAPSAFTASSSGTFASLSTGAIATAPAAFTTATTGNAGEQGTITAAPAAFAVASTGTFTAAGISGTIAAAPGVFTTSFAGNAGEQGTVTAAPAAFAVAASGTFTSSSSGTIGATPAAFTVAATGTFTSLSTGTIAVTPAPFTTAFAGNAGEQGTVAAAPAPFVAALTGTFTVAGGLAPPQVEIAVGASGSGANDFAPTLVRDSSNRLWLGTFTASTYLQNSGNQLRIYKADTTGIASSYTEQDTTHRPANVGTLSLAIDGSDLIHVAWQKTFTTPGGIFYQTFDTTTGLWVGTATQIGNTNWSTSSDTIVGDAGVSLALDSSGVPHVLYMGRASTATPQHIQYVNKVGGTWSSPAQIDTATLAANFNAKHPNMMFDSSGNLHATWMTFKDNYSSTGANGTAYYAKRTGTIWQTTPTAFAELLLGSIDNGPALYVDPADVVHITYGLGAAGVDPNSETVTGATVDNQVFYRYSADGGTTWNTTTQPAHFVTHDPTLGPDGAGGVLLWCHAQPPTVAGVGSSIGRMHRPQGSATWSAWVRTTTGTPSTDSTISTRHAQYFHNFPTKLDVQYFADSLPLTAQVGSDVPSILAAAPAAFTVALTGTVTSVTTGTIAAAPAVFTTTFAGSAGEQGTVAAAPGAFTVSASGTFTAAVISGTIAATPGIFTTATAGNAGEQGVIAALLAAAAVAASGTFTSLSSGTIAAAPTAFVTALTGNAGEQGSIAATPAPFIVAASGTYVPAGTTGTITAAPAAFIVSLSGNAGARGAVAVLPAIFTVAAAGTFTSLSGGTIVAAPTPFTTTFVGNAGEQGTVTAAPGVFTVSATGAFTTAGVSGTIVATLSPFITALSGNVGEQGAIAAILAPAVAALTGIFHSLSTGTIAATPSAATTSGTGVFLSSSSGVVAAQPAPFVAVLTGVSGALIVYGTVTLTDQAIATITLTDRAVTTITLTDQPVATITITITDEEGVVMNKYILGNVARLNAIIRDITGINVDAGTVIVSAKPPKGIIFTPVAATHGALGDYYYDYSLDVDGEHAVRVASTNPQAAAEIQMYVPPSLVA